MKSISRIKAIPMAALFAALYSILVLVLPQLSYEMVNVRIADALVGLVPIAGMPAVFGITLGVFIGNIPSPLGPIDLLSTLPTFLALLIVYALRRVSVFAGLVSYSVIIAVWVGYLLSYLFELPYLITFAYVLIGNAIATPGLGYILFKSMKRIMKGET
uniref:QueT transporter family protein n=1 Tax=Candidatus Methanomethylicus mesodigestus TaxID=1867258 RepID=A0A7C3EW49_9CREN